MLERHLQLDNYHTKLTIVVPTRDRNFLLIKTLNSLLLLPEVVAIIVVDDHSRKKVKFNNPRVLVVRNTKPLGEGLSINRGVKFIKTQYFAIISDDDPQDSTWLPEIFTMIKRKPGRVAYAPSNIIMKDGVPTKTIVAKRFAKYEIHYFDFMPCLAGVVIDLNKVRYHQVKDLRTFHIYPNDFLQWLKLSKIGKVQPVPKSYALWHIHSEQTSSILPLEIKARLYLENITSWKKANINFYVELAIAATFIRCAIMLFTRNKNWNQKIKWKLIFLIRGSFSVSNHPTFFPVHILLSGSYLVTRKVFVIFQDIYYSIYLNFSKKNLRPGSK